MKSHPDYDILEQLAQGPRANVYRAHNFKLGQDVAIKELSADARADPERLRQLQQTVQFLANLPSYDHVIRVFDIVLENGWIVLELMKASLGDRLKKEGQGQPHELVRSVLRQALQGLQTLHQVNRWHGEVKPSNLLIDDQGRVKLAESPGLIVDGIARPPEGTNKYLAPERIDPAFGNVGPATDLYALGFAVLELLVGPRFDNLFKGTGQNAVDAELGWMRLHGSTTERIPPALQLVPRLPSDLAKVIDRLLAKQVAQRYANASAALADLPETGELDLLLPDDAFDDPSQPTLVTKARKSTQAYPQTPAVQPPPPPPAPHQPARSPAVPPPASPRGKGCSNVLLFILGAFLAVCVTSIVMVVLLSQQFDLSKLFSDLKETKATLSKGTLPGASSSLAKGSVTAAGKTTAILGKPTPLATGMPVPVTTNKKTGKKPQQQRPFIPRIAMLRTMAKDLQSLPDADQPSQRYFTLVHLHNNPAISAAELQRWRTTLQGVVTYLTGKSALLTAVDPAKTIYRLDLNAAGWDSQTHWRKLLARYPYGLEPANDADDSENFLWKSAGSRPSWVRGDWFIVKATDGPLQVVLDLANVPLNPELQADVNELKAHYLQPINLQTATYELGLKDTMRVLLAVKTKPSLLKRGLEPLIEGKTIDRKVWASRGGTLDSAYQVLALELNLGAPYRLE